MSQLPSKAIAFTAYNRPGYLAAVLESWRNVRGLEDWYIYASVDPSPQTEAVVNLFAQFFRDEGLSLITTVVNDRKLGVLHHPWRSFEHLFNHGMDFVLRVEDDLKVSDDILEYFSWASEEFKGNEDIAAVIGYNPIFEGDEGAVLIRDKFDPWNWGTWKDRWDTYIRDTWDHDYSTYNGQPGNQAGWDWNLDTRVLPAKGKSCVFPAQSRVQNIGQSGTHAQPSDFPQSLSFHETYGEQTYRLVS